MTVEQWKGRPYLSGVRRVRGRVVMEYRGPLCAEDADYYRGRADDIRAMREHDRREARATVARADAELAAGAAFDRFAGRVFRVVMIQTGHRLHRRPEWRRTRGALPMIYSKDLPPGADGPRSSAR
ncbi:hypothetical protein [Urbifossiella limnaea]|uniref:Uncharacterized protein n=1 Tax=Urbifossiella limnaea TaxID=2528023 RepID=A0A517XS16_9BACT|nr:hypothetical protein [Urbifossiella limnaea]QDU20283.1 hypothetical protein ETAA1_22290 [Urbifossiella limnaea]